MLIGRAPNRIVRPGQLILWHAKPGTPPTYATGIPPGKP